MKINVRVNKRSFFSLSVFASFLVIAVTSVYMFSQPYDSAMALLHTIVGFTLLLVAVFHLKNNFNALKSYLNVRVWFAKSNRNLSLPLVLCLITGISYLSYNHLSPMQFVYEWGNTMRATTANPNSNELTYTLLDKTSELTDSPVITVDVRKGPYFTWPQYAIWVEDMQGNFVHPIFITEKLAKNNFVNKVTKIDKGIVFNSHVLVSGDVDLAKTFAAGVYPESKSERARPESLPVFLHKNMQSSAEQTLIPDGETAIGDAYTGATVNQSFLLTSNLLAPVQEQFKVRLEINTSFDFNEYYSSDRFPNDPIYSGNGYGAQPSLIYEAIISLNDNQKLYSMELIGRGHHSGQDGEIYRDLENITTAKQIVDRIVVEVSG